MGRFLLGAFVTSFFVVAMAHADSAVGTASGKGTLERLLPNDPDGNVENVSFVPKFSFAYSEGSGSKHSTWVVLSEKEPPVATLLAPGDRAEARRQWCEKEKAAWVAVKLDANFAVDLLFNCPGNGGMNTEMVSTINGLDSVVVNFDEKDDKHLRGSLKGGEGSCPLSDTENAYCTKRSDYLFDAPLVH